MSDDGGNKIDLNRLRFKDWREIESLTGRKMGWFVSALSAGMGELAADDLEVLVWVAGKRDNPAFTREEAGELGPADLKHDGDVDPTSAAG